MKKKVLVFLFAFMLMNSSAVYAEEDIQEEEIKAEQLQQNTEHQAGGTEKTEDIPEEPMIEKSEEIEESPVEEQKIKNESTGKAKVHHGWYYDKKISKWFYYDNKGTMKYGWLKDKGKWYYLDKRNTQHPGIMLSDCRMKIDGKIYLFDKSGTMQTGWVKRSEGWYYTNNSGAMQTGWQKLSGKWYYLNGSNKKYPGLMYENSKHLIDKKNYIFNKSGEMQTGWIKRSGSWYYADKSGAVQTGWKFLNKKWYYLNPHKDQKMAVGWVKVDDIWYYLNGSGEMQTGWKKISGKWYYLNGSGAMQIGWEKLKGKWYYLNADGAMQIGWEKVNGKWYYLNGSGVMQTGWQKLGNKWYYLGSDGGARTGWKKLGGIWYYFYKEKDTHGGPECAMAVNKTIEGWTITSSGEAYYKADIGEKIEEIKKYIYVPYRLGGDGPSGWDCSGFTQWALKYIGVSIPGTAATQYAGGKYVNKNNRSSWRPGDILIYAKGGKINHVALYLGNDMLMHALNTKYGTVIQGVDYYEKWDHSNSLYAVRRYL